MKKLILIIITFTSFTSILFGQDSSVIIADSLKKVGDLVEAIDAYAKHFKQNPSDKDNTYKYAEALALKNEIDSSFHYLNIALKKDTSIYTFSNPAFYSLIEDERWIQLQDMMIKRVELKHGKYEDLTLSKKLWKIGLLDQAFYYHLLLAGKELGWDSPIVTAIGELKNKLDASNLAQVVEIVDTYGWPKESIVKGTAASAIFLVVQHASLEVQQKYLPMMTEAANQGEADWSSLALLIDRVNLREGKQQIYGSQITMDENNVHIVDDLFEPEYVDQRRKEVGLGPIEDYVNRWNIKWDIKQKTKK